MLNKVITTFLITQYFQQSFSQLVCSSTTNERSGQLFHYFFSSPLTCEFTFDPPNNQSIILFRVLSIIGHGPATFNQNIIVLPDGINLPNLNNVNTVRNSSEPVWCGAFIRSNSNGECFEKAQTLCPTRQDEPEQLVGEEATTTTETATTQLANTRSSDSSIMWIAVALGVVVIICIATITVTCLRNRNNKPTKTTSNNTPPPLPTTNRPTNNETFYEIPIQSPTYPEGGSVYSGRREINNELYQAVH